jgi:hypothetical protein
MLSPDDIIVEEKQVRSEGPDRREAFVYEAHVGYRRQSGLHDRALPNPDYERLTKHYLRCGLWDDLYGDIEKMIFEAERSIYQATWPPLPDFASLERLREIFQPLKTRIAESKPVLEDRWISK